MTTPVVPQTLEERAERFSVEWEGYVSPSMVERLIDFAREYAAWEVGGKSSLRIAALESELAAERSAREQAERHDCGAEARKWQQYSAKMDHEADAHLATIERLEAELAEWRKAGAMAVDSYLSSYKRRAGSAPVQTTACPFPGCELQLPTGTELHHGAWHAGEEPEPLPAIPSTPETGKEGTKP